MAAFSDDEAAQAYLSAIVDSADDAIISKDLNGIIKTWNAGAERVFGYRAAEVIGKPVRILIPADRQPEEDSILARLRQGERVNHFETVRLRKNGEPVDVSLTISPVRSRDGAIIGASKIARDITEQKRAAAELAEQQAWFRTTLSSIGDAVIACDPHGNVTFANPTAVSLTGWPEAEARGRPLHEVFKIVNETTRLPVENPVSVVMKLGHVVGLANHTVLISKNGVETPIADSAAPIRSDSGATLGVVLVFRDVSAEREADRRKDEFLATLAHELRNPLAPIRNALEILRMPRATGDTVERARAMMERQVHQLVRLVDDLLDVSRVMGGKIELRRETVEVATVIARAVETVQPLIDAQNHQLTISVPTESMLIEADTVRLSQVISNLLTNAAKYTDPGGHLTLSAQHDDDCIELRIKDNGIGLAPEMQSRIFDLFVQVDHSTARSQGGLGIGLTLARNLVELHHGSISAHSDGLSKGTEFIVRLPRFTGATSNIVDSDTVQARTMPASRSRVLVVDDNSDAADSMAILLRSDGHDVTVASSGEAALDAIRTHRPDIVFLDIGMPDMDGYEVASRVRQEYGPDGIALVALTGWGQPRDRERSAAAGFDHHLVKPFDPQEIAMLIETIRGEHKS